MRLITITLTEDPEDKIHNHTCALHRATVLATLQNRTNTSRETNGNETHRRGKHGINRLTGDVATKGTSLQKGTNLN